MLRSWNSICPKQGDCTRLTHRSSTTPSFTFLQGWPMAFRSCTQPPLTSLTGFFCLSETGAPLHRGMRKMIQKGKPLLFWRCWVNDCHPAAPTPELPPQSFSQSYLPGEQLPQQRMYSYPYVHIYMLHHLLVSWNYMPQF